MERASAGYAVCQPRRYAGFPSTGPRHPHDLPDERGEHPHEDGRHAAGPRGPLPEQRAEKRRGDAGAVHRVGPERHRENGREEVAGDIAENADRHHDQARVEHHLTVGDRGVDEPLIDVADQVGGRGQQEAVRRGDDDRGGAADQQHAEHRRQHVRGDADDDLLRFRDAESAERQTAEDPGRIDQGLHQDRAGDPADHGQAGRPFVARREELLVHVRFAEQQEHGRQEQRERRLRAHVAEERHLMRLQRRDRRRQPAVVADQERDAEHHGDGHHEAVADVEVRRSKACRRAT